MLPACGIVDRTVLIGTRQERTRTEQQVELNVGEEEDPATGSRESKLNILRLASTDEMFASDS